MKDSSKSPSEATEYLDLLKHHLPRHASRKISQMMFVKLVDFVVYYYTVFISMHTSLQVYVQKMQVFRADAQLEIW